MVKKLKEKQAALQVLSDRKSVLHWPELQEYCPLGLLQGIYWRVNLMQPKDAWERRTEGAFHLSYWTGG